MKRSLQEENVQFSVDLTSLWAELVGEGFMVTVLFIHTHSLFLEDNNSENNDKKIGIGVEIKSSNY